MEGSKPIYVETVIRTDMETLWAHTQRPELHCQWDARFSTITYDPSPSSDDRQTFTYSTRIGFGLSITGTGETRSKVSDKRKERLSTLTFGSRQPLSLIRTGAGYWKYTQLENNQSDDPRIRFLTQYDYKTRFGPIGKLFDRWLFRPLFGYATAWSFDVLRFWLETSVPPRVIIRQAAIHYGCVAALAGLWLCQGLLPKLLFPHFGELALMEAVNGIPAGWAPMLIKLLGAAEIAIGAATLALHRSRAFLRLQILLLALLAILACIGNPALLLSPYNPGALSAAMSVLSMAAIQSGYDLPRAGRCLRKPASNGGRLQ